MIIKISFYYGYPEYEIYEIINVDEYFQPSNIYLCDRLYNVWLACIVHDMINNMICSEKDFNRNHNLSQIIYLDIIKFNVTILKLNKINHFDQL